MEDRAPTGGPDPLEVVEDRLERARVTPPAVEPEGNAMRFVPSTLEKLQTRIVAIEPINAQRSGERGR